MTTEATLGSAASPVCPNHPETPASYLCGRCQQLVCFECCYSLPDDSTCCKACWEQAAVLATEPAQPKTVQIRLAHREPSIAVHPSAAVPATQTHPCRQHPHARPVARCCNCGAGVCKTCDFPFPNRLHYCPVCVTASQDKLSPRRKRYLSAAYILGACATLFLVLFLGGAVAGWAGDEAGQMLLGVALILLTGFPSLIGTALGMSALRPGANPISVWVGLIWNALLLGGMTVITLVGNLTE